MTDTYNHKCPACGGAMNFDIKTHMLKCQFCDTEVPVDDPEATKGAKKFNEGEFVRKNHYSEPEEPLVRHLADGDDPETTKHDTYACPQCGGAIEVSPTTVSTICPYCENNVVFYDKLVGNHVPDLVVPFKLDKDVLLQKYQEHLKNKPFVPKLFKRDNRIENIKGYYIPFWIYDMTAMGSAKFSAERDIGDKTSVYNVFRTGSQKFEKIPEDACIDVDDALTESLEPFAFDDSIPFKPEYLPSFISYVYDESCQSCAERASNRAATSLVDTLEHETVTDYTRVSFESDDIKTSDISAQSVLYPIWMMKTKWENKEFTFALNAQTGTFVGNLPRNNALYFGSMTIFAVLLWFVLQFFFKGADWWIPVVAGLAVSIIGHIAVDSSRVSVVRATKANSYGDIKSFKLLDARDEFVRSYTRNRK